MSPPPRAAWTLRAMTTADWPQVRRIYEEGLATGKASFETAVPTWEAWDAGHLAAARIVAARDPHLLGWAALMPVSARACYRGVAEVSVYVGEDARGMGVGLGLMEALIRESEAAGIWTLWSSIHADNPVSIRLHERAGFRLIGTREKIALRGGEWTSTVNMERRSTTVGV